MRRRRPYRYTAFLAWHLSVLFLLLRTGCCRGGQGEHGQALGSRLRGRDRCDLCPVRHGREAPAAAAAVLAWRRLSRRHGAPMMTFAHERTRPRGSANSPAVLAAVALLGRRVVCSDLALWAGRWRVPPSRIYLACVTSQLTRPRKLLVDGRFTDYCKATANHMRDCPLFSSFHMHGSKSGLPAWIQPALELASVPLTNLRHSHRTRL